MALGAATTLSLVASSCSNVEPPNSNNNNNNTVKVDSINLSIDKNSIYLDETATLTVIILPENASNKTYSFSYDSSLISINDNIVSPKAIGKTEITVISQDGALTDSVNIEIKDYEKVEYTSEEQILENLSSSPYSTEMIGEDFYGLSDLSSVGVDESRMNDELYPVPTDATIYKAKDYGIEGEKLNNSELLNGLIAEIGQNDGTKVIMFEDATYYFGSTIRVNNASNLYLVGQANTKFILTGWTTYLSASKTTNFHINSIKFDMNPSPTIVGEITNVVDKGTSADITLSIPDEFDLSNPIYETWRATRKISYAECYFDELAKWYVPNRDGNLFYNSNSEGIADLVYHKDSKELVVTLNKNFAYYSYKTPKIGTIASVGFTVYEYFGFLLSDCENTYFEDVTTYVTAGMGLRSNGGKNLYLNRTNFMHNPDSKRILTCTADIIHTAALEGDLKVTNSIIEGSHDDGLNIKTYYTEVTSNKASNKIAVKQTQNEVIIDYDVGDVIDVYDRNGLEFKGRFTITDVQDLGGTYTLTLDGSLRNATGLLVGNDTKATHLSLDNCLIQNKRNRGILLQARKSEIKNCTFLNVNMGAVQVLGVGDQFSEAIVPQDIKIYNCKFLNSWDDCRSFTYGYDGKTYPNTLQNLEIYNNLFFNGIGLETYLLGVGNASVHNNFYYKTSERSIDSYSSLIEVSYSDKIDIRDNRALIKGDNSLQFVKEGSGVTNITIDNNEFMIGD